MMKPGINSKGKVLKKNPQLSTRAYSKGEKKQQIQTNFADKGWIFWKNISLKLLRKEMEETAEGLELDDL